MAIGRIGGNSDWTAQLLLLRVGSSRARYWPASHGWVESHNLPEIEIIRATSGGRVCTLTACRIKAPGHQISNTTQPPSWVGPPNTRSAAFHRHHAHASLGPRPKHFSHRLLKNVLTIRLHVHKWSHRDTTSRSDLLIWSWNFEMTPADALASI